MQNACSGYWIEASEAAGTRHSLPVKFNVPSVKFNLYPFFKKDMQNWLLLNEQAHTRMAGYLRFATQDLSNLNFDDKTAFDDWLWLHYNEHLSAAQRLGTTIT